MAKIKHTTGHSRNLRVSNHPMHSGGYYYGGLGLAPSNGLNNLGESPQKEAEEEASPTESSEPGEATEK